MKLLLMLLVVASGCTLYYEPSFNVSNETRVYQVIDGDTFLLSEGEYVRIIGIDAPEIGKEGYHEAADFLRNLTEGKPVVLESEGPDRDQYGRLLRHVYINNESVRKLMLERNLSAAYE